MIFIVAASVFLCLLVSCGIPTYLIPTVASITRGQSSEVFEDIFTLHYESDSESASSDQVGLLLLYYVGDSTNSAKSSVNSQFKSKYRPTQYDGNYVDVQENTPVLSYKSSDTTYELYAFETGSGVVGAPLYTLQIPDNNANYTIKLTYNDTTKAAQLECRRSDDTFVESKTLYFDDSFELTGELNFVHVWGTISVQGKNYSNLYWSDLQYCGSLQAE